MVLLIELGVLAGRVALRLPRPLDSGCVVRLHERLQFVRDLDCRQALRSGRIRPRWHGGCDEAPYPLAEGNRDGVADACGRVFNRPSATARTQGVLLGLQHSFEMLLKAVVWEDRGCIQPKGGGQSYSLRYCLGIVRGMGKLSEDEEIVAATIAGQRDAVQHQGAAVTDERLYLDAASGLGLFDDLLHRCFSERLADHPEFANRMLPVTANPPREMHLLTSSDVQHVRDLLKPPKRRHAEALALLRTLVVSEQVAADPAAEPNPPTEHQLERIAKKLQEADDWTKVLPGLAKLSLEQDEGTTYNLRIVKEKTASPVRVVRSGDEGAEDAVSILKVSELEYWCYYLKDLASEAGITRYEAEAFVHLLDLKSDPDAFRTFAMGKQEHARYSGRALHLIREAKSAGRVEEAKAALREHRRTQRQAKKQAPG